MTGAWCAATTARDGVKVKCMKRRHQPTEQHASLDSQGRDVVWLEVTLPPKAAAG
jgi:hypothetical protein